MRELYNVEFNKNFNNLTDLEEGLRIVLVLNGMMKVINGDSVTNYQKGEVFLINHRASCRFSTHKNTLYLSIHLTESYLKQYMNDYKDKAFILNKNTLQEVIYQQIVNAVAKIGIVYIRKGEFYRLYIEQQLIDLVFIMMRYLPTTNIQAQMPLVADDRLAYICEYIDKHYTESIKLTEMADMVGLSDAYLSKLFKQKKGVGFNQYVNHVRLEQCKNDLIYTNEPITQIAYKNGFSNSNALLKYFKAETTYTPSNYRLKFQMKEQHIKVNDCPTTTTYQSYLYYLSLLIDQNIGDIVQSPDAQKVIDITLQNDGKSISHYQHVIQVGYLETILTHRVRRQLIEVKTMLGLDHILIKDPIQQGRINHSEIESDEMIPNIHPYMQVDESINFLIKHQIGLGIELTPPRSTINFTQYYQELTYLLEHIFNGLPNNNLLKFVVYIDCKQDSIFNQLVALFKYYFTNVEIVLNVDIGKLEAPHKAKRILERSDRIVDRIAFSANQNDMIDFQSIESQQYELAKRHIYEQFNKVVETLELQQSSISFILLNWNTLTGDTHLTNGEYFRAGIIFEQLIEMNDRIQMIGYWLNYELHEQFKLKDSSAQLTGIELYHQFDGKRPAFFTSAFYRKLFDQVLYQSENCMVVGSTDHFQIVMWDAEHYNPYYILNHHAQYLNHKEYQINIINAHPGTYKIKHMTLDKNNGALYTVWQHYNTRYGMDEETIAYVNRISYPKMDISEVKVNDTITYHLKLLTNAIQIIEFKKYLC